MKTSLVLSNDPLCKLLVGSDLNKTQLQEQSGISAATMAKLGKGGNIITNILARICETLDCGIADICEVVPVTTKGATK